MMKWQVVETGPSSAAHNMQLDSMFLSQLSPTSNPLLHFYDWISPSATYGYFIRPEHYLNREAVDKWNLQLARRSTGGGIVFHLSDLAFSVLIPSGHSAFSHNTLQNYAFVNRYVAQAIQKFLKGRFTPTLLIEESVPLDSLCCSFCMAKPTKHDVMIEGRKISGGAQRRTKNGFLHQGTIALELPSDALLDEVLIPGTKVVEGMRNHSFALLDSPTEKEMQEAKIELQQLLIQAFQEE
jgi:lipoate-protein ligase A